MEGLIPVRNAAAAEVSVKRGIAAPLVDGWLEARRALREAEQAEHPDVTDALGRVWTWMDGDIYTHDGMAWPLDHITHPGIGWPTAAALDNPNYQWCATCRWGAR
jgi:hypothetical protein